MCYCWVEISVSRQIVVAAHVGSCWHWGERHTFPFFSQEAGNFVLWHRMTAFPFRNMRSGGGKKHHHPCWIHPPSTLKPASSSAAELLPVPHVCLPPPTVVMHIGPSGPLQPISNRKSCHAQPHIRSSSRRPSSLGFWLVHATVCHFRTSFEKLKKREKKKVKQRC